MKLEEYQIKQNEQFFRNVINILNEGGSYVFPAAQQTYKKIGDTVVGSQDALDAVKGLVTDQFFNQYFKLEEDGRNN
jgi:hypothetical protein